LKKYPSKTKELTEYKKKYTKYRQFNFKGDNNKIKSIKINSFLTKFFKSLTSFVSGKTNIFVTFQKLDKDLKKNSSKKEIKILKNDLIKLRRYKQNKFFEEGVRALFISTRYYNSASLLAQFLATQLQKNKRPKFFLNFVKTTLTRFKDSSPLGLGGIKIKIKGRFNGAPRAKHQVMLVGSGVPNLTIDANIDYSEKTSYTSNGTFGVKVWIYTSTINNVKRTKTS
jgi:ribosomal protein S3